MSDANRTGPSASAHGDGSHASGAGAPTPPTRKPSVRRRVAGLAIIALLTDQALLWLGLADGEFAGTRVAPYSPPLISPQHVEALAWLQGVAAGEVQDDGFFDAELGWCPRPGTRKGLYAYDDVGSRIGAAPITRERTPGVRRVVLVGGSFARGDEVEGDETWAAQLDAQLDDVEIANLGVGGFGIDQAWLRLRRDGLELEPDEVWLAFFPQATARLLSIYRPALQHHTPQLALKPRLLLDDDPGAAALPAGDLPGARLVPAPVTRLADVAGLLTDPERFAAATEHDRWIARDRLAWSAPGWHPLHATALGRLWLTLQVRELRVAAPLLAEPDGELPRLVRAVARGMAADAASVGAGFRLVVLPGRGGLRQRADAGGVAPWDGLVDTLRAEGMDVFDASETLMGVRALGRGELWMPGGHYAPDANTAVAGALREHLGDP